MANRLVRLGAIGAGAGAFSALFAAGAAVLAPRPGSLPFVARATR